MTVLPDPPGYCPARRGSLALMQRRDGGPVYVGIVQTVTRDGIMRRVDWAYDPEGAEQARRGCLRTLLAPRDRIADLPGLLAAARGAAPCESLEDMFNTLRPYLNGA